MERLERLQLQLLWRHGGGHRHVTSLPVGMGQRCQETSLKEVAPCNPAMDEERPSGCRNQGPQNCTSGRPSSFYRALRMGQWEAWSVCTKPCGGGQRPLRAQKSLDWGRTRMRLIQSPLQHNGAPCEGELAEIDPCNDFHCPENHCIDCEWGRKLRSPGYMEDLRVKPCRSELVSVYNYICGEIERMKER